MKLKFTKMHGAGNDYIFFDCTVPEIKDPASTAVRICKRHTSVGGDGIVIILPSDIADARMRIFNADGSEARMCGNAVRCVAKYLYDNNIIKKTDISVETLSGVKYISLSVRNGETVAATVDMGYASVSPMLVPHLFDEPMLNTAVSVNGTFISMSAISVGNPHAVIFVNDTKTADVDEIGPAVENHKLFPDRTNVEFVKVTDRNTLCIRVWERGSGETLACGTGACAAAAAAALCGSCKYSEDIRVISLGGELTVKVEPDLHVYLTGECVKAFDGEVELPDNLS